MAGENPWTTGGGIGRKRKLGGRSLRKIEANGFLADKHQRKEDRCVPGEPLKSLLWKGKEEGQPNSSRQGR